MTTQRKTTEELALESGLVFTSSPRPTEMTNETKQPTLPEVLVKVRDKIDMISISSLTHPRVKTVADEALSLLDSVQITSEPVAEYKVHPFGNGMPSLQWHPSFDLKLGTKLFDHAKPCAHCAESRWTAEYWKAEHLAGNERIATLEAEKDAERLDFLDKLNHALNSHYGTTYGWKLIFSQNIVRVMCGAGGNGRVADIDLNDADAHGSKSCRLAIDAAITASREWK